MKKKNSLYLGQIFLFLLVFISFGTIIVTSKYLVPHITSKLNTYLKDNYKDILKDVKVSKLYLKNESYYLKVMNKENNKLYFTLTYTNKKVISTYQKDYVEGSTLLTSLGKELSTSDYTVTFNTKLNEYTTDVKERLLKEDNLATLPVYTVNAELYLSNFTNEDIAATITSFNNKLSTTKYTPKDYVLTIKDKTSTKALKISGLTPTLIESSSFNSIISAIMNKEKDPILSNNNITYKYLN